LAARVNRSEP